MIENIGELATERMNPEWARLDCMGTLEMVRLMNEADRRIMERIAGEAENIARAVELAADRLLSGGRLIYAGAGTSGRLGILDAVECRPTFGVPDGMILGLIAGGEGAFVKAVEGAEDSDSRGADDLKRLGAGKNDILAAISASGRTPYCIGAMRYAREAGCAVISVSCNRNARMSRLADVAVEIDSGPEVLAGSTRLKAGTAQKIVLNMISTLSMVKIGKVYKNFMVDMKATNEKLKDRAIRLLMHAAAIQDIQEAARLLEAAEWNVKTAIVMAACEIGKTDAQKLLAENRGFVRKALQGREGFAEEIG